MKEKYQVLDHEMVSEALDEIAGKVPPNTDAGQLIHSLIDLAEELQKRIQKLETMLLDQRTSVTSDVSSETQPKRVLH